MKDLLASCSRSDALWLEEHPYLLTKENSWDIGNHAEHMLLLALKKGEGRRALSVLASTLRSCYWKISVTVPTPFIKHLEDTPGGPITRALCDSWKDMLNEKIAKSPLSDVASIAWLTAAFEIVVIKGCTIRCASYACHSRAVAQLKILGVGKLICTSLRKEIALRWT